jgi:hypothetical protein
MRSGWWLTLGESTHEQRGNEEWLSPQAAAAAQKRRKVAIGRCPRHAIEKRKGKHERELRKEKE